MLAKITCTQKEKAKSKREILLDFYGEKKGSLYEFGLAEASDEHDFVTKLNLLQEKWESHCKGFYHFLSNRKDVFISSVICSARTGTNVYGLFYQNDIESQHYFEKIRQNFRKKSIQTAIDDFQLLNRKARQRRNASVIWCRILQVCLSKKV